MNNSAAQRIKEILETSYDIPFDVIGGLRDKDAWYDIKPHSNEEELFDIDVKFKNQLRLVIEVTPEKYSAFSIKDMATASEEKKKIFAEYARQLSERKARIEFFINDTVCNPEEPDTWPTEWRNYRLRVSRSPIISEDEKFDEVEITGSWTIIIIGMFLSLLNVIYTEKRGYLEGGVKKIQTNKYERNPVNRELCLTANGYVCKICGFDFEETYGSIGHHFIHVHHIVPVSKMENAYEINPVKDLNPVCPNCHAMLHQSDPPLLPEDLRLMIQNKNTKE